MSAFHNTGFGSLQGLKVLDFTQALAGPYCTSMLADHGADVIKVESLTGDGSRFAGPYRDEDTEKSLCGYFQSVNRNKRSISVDLKSEEGRDAMRKLALEADVVVENFRSGVMDRLGLSYETLSAENPKLVYAAIRGFGDPRTGASPYKDWPSFDVVSQAMGSLITTTGPDPETLAKVGPGAGDIVPAMMTAFAIMAAIYRARETGQGQFVDVGMVDAVLSLCERNVYLHSYKGLPGRPEGNRHPLICPFAIFPAKDGHVAIACARDNMWQTLCKELAMPQFASDERFATGRDRLKNRAECEAVITERTSKLTKAELTSLLGGKIPYGPVMDMVDISADEHFTAREMIVDVEQPGCATPSKIAGIPAKMTETPGRIAARSPLLGEHTQEILSAIGYTADEIANLIETDAVKATA